MGIPFLSIYAYATTLEQNRSYKVNDQVKIQESLIGVFAPLKIQVIRSYFVFEKVVADDVAVFEILGNHYYGLNDVQSIKQVENTTNDSLLLAFRFKEGTVIKAFK